MGNFDNILPRRAWEKVHYELVTYNLVMLVVDKQEIFVRVNQYQYLTEILEEQRALVG